MRYYTLPRLRADLAFGNAMAAVITGMAALPVVGMGVVNAFSVWSEGSPVVSWSFYALLLIVLPASYFVVGNLSALAFWLLRPLRRSIWGYALTGAVVAVIAYPAVGLSLDWLEQRKGDGLANETPPVRDWAYYQSMVSTFGLVGFCGRLWCWYKEGKTTAA